MREGAEVGLVEHVLCLSVVIENGASTVNQGGVVEVIEAAGVDHTIRLHRGAPCSTGQG